MQYEHIDKNDLKLIREACRHFHSKLLKKRRRNVPKIEREILNDDIEQLERIICIFNDKIKKE